MRWKINKIGILLTVCLTVLAAGNALAAESGPSDPANVLLLYSWYNDMPWQKSVETGLKRTIAEKQLPVRLYEEYIDGSRFPITTTSDAFYRLFEAKYSGIHMDMVISESFSATQVMHRSENLFPDARKLAVQSQWHKADIENKELWRIDVAQDYAAAISAMIDVCHPKHLFVVADVANADGKTRLANFKRELETVAADLPVTYLTDPTLAAVIDRTRELPEKSAIFYLLYFRDGKGARLTPYQAAQRISATAGAPIFTHWDSLMGSGVVGGYLLSGEMVGTRIAEAVAACIRNKQSGQATRFDSQGGRLFEHQYDWRQLQRWHIDRHQLPENARVLYYTPGLIESYPVEMAALLSFTGLLVVLSLALGIQTWRRKKIAEKLEESQERLNAIFKANPDSIVVFDAKGNAQYLNPEFKRQLGWPKGQLDGWQFPFVAPSGQEDMDALIRSLATRNGPVRVEIKGVSAQGRAMDLIASAAVIEGATEGTTGIVLSLTDISAQKKLESQLQQVQKMESVGRLAGGVAHEFNNMLSVIIGNAEMVAEDVQSDEFLAGCTREIQEAAHRSRDLVRQLLAFARKQTISPRVLSLNATIENSLKMLQRLIGEDIELAWLPSVKLWLVKIDPSQIDQMLANLCANARDAIKGVGRITIKTENVHLSESEYPDTVETRPGDYVMMLFSDTGCGMDKKDLENLFEPFYTRKEIGQGTGLGLSTIYGIVKQNNGTIEVASELGQGTTFRIYFPRHQQADGVSAKEEAQAIPARKADVRILLVEDEEAILKMTAMILQREGYHVLSASSPGQALELLDDPDTPEIHLLMTDVVMPGMNGRDLSEKILAVRPHMKCLFMSGYSDKIIGDKGVMNEDAVLIKKPFSREELIEKVREVLDSLNR